MYSHLLHMAKVLMAETSHTLGHAAARAALRFTS